ncbi:hypothetical protein [Nocardia sp. NPDC050793]|uniref:hypothetical protein n=1 Tax=Nocardia sp. NPDC050793 TaxID=3155159 RepID=UPI0034080B40
MNPGQDTGWPRGGLVGALVGLLSVAAHGAAGGGYPDSPEFALLLTVSALAGCATTAGFAENGACGAPGTERHRNSAGLGIRLRPSRGAGPMLGALAVGQLGGHAVLAGHTHAERASHIPRGDAPLAGFVPTGWMLFAHLLATLACAGLILAAERLYAIVSGAARAVLGEPRHLPVARAGRWADHRTPTYRFPPQGPVGPRAPPAFA